MKAIVEGTQPSPNFGDGLQIARIAEAISASSESGSWVDVPALVGSAA